MTLVSNVHKDERDRKQPVLTPNAMTVLEKRYLLQNDRGEIIETPAQLFTRVAKAIAANESRYGLDPAIMEKQYYDMMVKFEFLPNSPTLMNAGTKINQLSACFVLPVEDDMTSIFQAIKNAAVIHKSGGGCVAKGTRVFTSYCGIEKIETIYDHYADKNNPVSEENAESIDITEKPLQTFSFDPTSGEIVSKPILKLWKYKINTNSTIKITTIGRNTISTSNWHPFFVWNGSDIIEKRADELQIGEYLITPNKSGIKNWPYKAYHVINGIELNEDFAYLIGLFQTDGSIDHFKNTKTGWEGLRLRFYSTDNNLLEAYNTILEQITGKKYSIQTDNRTIKGKRIPLKSITSYNSRLNEAIKIVNRELIGSKSKSVRIPELIFKSPIPVISAYIAAVLDGDGHVIKNEKKIQFSTGSKEFSEDLRSLLSVLGIKSRFRERKDTRESRQSLTYEITISGRENFQSLADIILEYLVLNNKRERITSHLKRLHSSESCPISFTTLEPFLRKAGINTASTEIWRKSIQIGNNKYFLARWKEKNKINVIKVVDLITELLTIYNESFTETETNFLHRLTRVLPSLTTITNISSAEEETFYDFTVKDTNNYLAGNGLFYIIHNTGFSFSRLRPTNDKVQTTGGVASGPISFMTVFNSATEIIKQGGRRRGANMGVLRVDHPDILEFIECKQDLKTLNNFNISVGLTEAFMKAVLSDTDYPLINPRNNEIAEKLNARKVFEKIVDMAYKSGEPGILFLDRINAANPTPHVGEIEATNPCGEQPLLPYESCNLGSINLGKMVKIDSNEIFGFSIDYEKLKQITRLSVRFLDNVIDLSTFPLPEIEEMTKANRKIGLGIMGFADLLIKLGIPYDSTEGTDLSEKVMNFIHDIALQASQDLAHERGSFPNFSGSTLAKNYPMMRNATLTTMAPTGTISIIAGCSSGIEPLFMLTYERRVLDDDILVEGYPFFVETAKRLNFYSQSLMEQVVDTGSIADIDEIPEEIKRVFVTAHDITPEAHVRMQAAFQSAGVDNAVSKTINFPNHASSEDIQKAYLFAYELGCKGITVYRSGSRTYDVLSKKGTNEQTTDTVKPVMTKKPRQRPSITQGITERVRVGCGTNLFITINEDEEGLTELFLSLGKSGGCVASHIEAMGRLISLTLRSRIEPEEIILQLKAIRCPSPTFGPDGPVLSCADAVAKSVERFIELHSQNGNGKNESSSETSSNEDQYEPETLYLSHTTSGLRPECPECGNIVEHSEGCILCRVCGYSKCG